MFWRWRGSGRGVVGGGRFVNTVVVVVEVWWSGDDGE